VNLLSQRFSALALAVVPFLGCSGATDPVCSGPVTVTATSAARPTFAWTPSCLVDQVYVEESIAPSAGGPQPRWIIQSRVTGQGAPSPFAYGQVPFGMREALTAATLVSGHHYRVGVYDSAMREIGAAGFTP